MKRAIWALLLFAAVALAGYFAYHYFMNWHTEELESAREQVRDEMNLQESPPPPAEKLARAFGTPPPDVSRKDEAPGPMDIERRIRAFFTYLDSRDYISAYNLEGGTYGEYRRVLSDLSSTPPLIVGETESLHTLYRNMAHFFRVLGPARVNLAKDILRNESEIIESVAELYYLFFVSRSAPGQGALERPSSETLYQYSGFFLNTLSGRSYLLRRGPKVRTLTAFYSVLFLDRANALLINSKGIDIRPHIQSLHQEIGSQKGLVKREKYLSTLEQLAEKYRL